VLVLYAPRNRPGLVLLLAAGTFPLVIGTHEAGALLAPGWVALTLHARSRRGAPPTPRGIALVVAALGASAMGALVLANLWRGLGLRPEAASPFGVIENFHVFRPWTVLVESWLGGLGASALLALVGALHPETRGARGLVLAWLLLPPLAFHLWWGPLEHGGYFLGSAPFLAALGCALPRVRRRWAMSFAVALLLAQGVVAYRAIKRLDNGIDPRRRVAALRALIGVRGTVVSSDAVAPSIRIYLPEVEEITLVPLTARVAMAREDPDSWAEAVLLPRFRHFVATRPDPIVYDLSFRLHPAELGTALPYLEAIAAMLERNFEVRATDPAGWPLLRVGN
jgi:hypothetical protein